MRHCVYFEQALGVVMIKTTANVDQMLRRLNRAARKASGSASAVIAAVVVDKVGAQKLRRAIARAWSGQRRGGAAFTVSPGDVMALAEHLAGRFQLTVYGPGRKLSEGARSLALHRFARGRRSTWIPSAGDDLAALEEMMAAGLVTRHRGGRYRGSERTASLARRAATGHVPARGKPSIVISNTPVLGEAVVPEPQIAREWLLARMGEAAEAGSDPQDVLHRDAYRGALVNLRDQLGGFALLDLDEFQRRGVSEFRQSSEEGQLGGAKAIDYAVTRVDSSRVNSVTEAGAGARASHRAACDMLRAPRPGEDEKDRKPGLVRVAVAERLAIHGHSLREISIALGMGSGGAARNRTKAIALGVATDLARHFGYLRGSRSPLRAEASKQSVPEAFRQEITVGSRGKREKA